MAIAITSSVQQGPVPLRIVLVSQAFTSTISTLEKRLAGFRSQTDIAASTDFPPGNEPLAVGGVA
ncbi:hypothetical protein AU190_08680 [Mycolicibacterium acapulense]|nr:hypothetical protein AU190_08680 [Mycolicibacterium acapulense]KUI15587.1 hypothetical protein AU191_10230 [Mycolicibacterium acapulense]